MDKNIKLLLIPTIILVGGMGTTLNNICYCMESLTHYQQLELRNKEEIAKALRFTGNDLLKTMDYFDLEFYSWEQFSTIKDIVKDLDNYYKPQSNMYSDIINAMNDLDLRNADLHNPALDSESYNNAKTVLDSFSLSRPEVINVKKVNQNDTITLTQLWNYIRNKTDQIKLKCFHDIKEFIDNNKKNSDNINKNEYYSKIKEIILSGYFDLYSFLKAAGYDIEEYIEKNNPKNKHINELLEKIALGISKLEYITPYLFYLVNLQGKFKTFNFKYNNVLQKYLSSNALNSKWIMDILNAFKQTLSNCKSKNSYPQSEEEYYKGCLDIFGIFIRIYSSITAQIDPPDEKMLLEDYDNDKNQLKLNDIKWQTGDLIQVLNTEFYNNEGYCNGKNEFNNLFKEQNQNGEITCAQLLQYFTNNISKKVIHTIQNIENEVLNKRPNNYLELYDILNANINNFVNQIDNITNILLDFLTNELKNNEKIQNNGSSVIVNVILKKIHEALTWLPEKFKRIKNHKDNTKNNLIKAIKYK